MENEFDFQRAASEARTIFGRLLDNSSPEFTRALNNLVLNLVYESISVSEATDEQILKFSGLDESLLAKAAPEAKTFLVNMLKTGIKRTKSELEKKQIKLNRIKDKLI